MSQNQQRRKFKFTSPEGRLFCRQILQQKLPYDPHDYQLAGVTTLLDGKDFLGVSATGSGKTAYIYMLLLVIHEILINPELCPSAKFPADPAILVIYPTTALEEDQELRFRQLGLTAKAVNSATKAAVAENGGNIWTTVESKISVILLSPEMLSTPGFSSLIGSKVFQSRLFAIGVDEAHLLVSWGDSFRKAFQQIKYVRARFKEQVAMFGMTATLREGEHTKAVCDFLGFRDGDFTFLRRSNARPDIRLVFRSFHSSSASEDFPDLDWVLQEPGKTLIFCSSIRFGFKIAVYMWHLNPKDAVQKKTIRLFNSLNEDDYNAETLELLRGDTASQITIATDKLSVGVDIPDFRTVIVLEPKNLDDLWQKAGRVGRDKSKVKDAQVFVYIPQRIMEPPQASSRPKKSGKKKANATPVHGNESQDDSSSVPVDSSLQKVIDAKCKHAGINQQYNNPTIDTPCTCRGCASLPSPFLQVSPPCNCSGCKPEPLPSIFPRYKAPRIALPMSVHITKEMREVGTASLKEFRDDVWENADEISAGLLPLERYMPERVIDTILDLLPTFLSPPTLESLKSDMDEHIDPAKARTFMAPFTRHNADVADRSHDLVQRLLDLHAKFDEMRGKKKEQEREKRAAKKAGVTATRGEPLKIRISLPSRSREQDTGSE